MENKDINKQQNDQSSKLDINKKSDAGAGDLKQDRDVNKEGKFSQDQQGSKRSQGDVGAGNSNTSGTNR